MNHLRHQLTLDCGRYLLSAVTSHVSIQKCVELVKGGILGTPGFCAQNPRGVAYETVLDLLLSVSQPGEKMDSRHADLVNAVQTAYREDLALENIRSVAVSTLSALCEYIPADARAGTLLKMLGDPATSIRPDISRKFQRALGALRTAAMDMRSVDGGKTNPLLAIDPGAVVEACDLLQHEIWTMTVTFDDLNDAVSGSFGSSDITAAAQRLQEALRAFPDVPVSAQELSMTP